MFSHKVEVNRFPRTFKSLWTMVARWFIFKPKIPIWVNFGGCFAMEDVDIFYGHLVYCLAIWYLSWLLGINFPVLVCCSNKNLATLTGTTSQWRSILRCSSQIMTGILPQCDQKWFGEKIIKNHPTLEVLIKILTLLILLLTNMYSIEI
jgi:hypothetical protein